MSHYSIQPTIFNSFLLILCEPPLLPGPVLFYIPRTVHQTQENGTDGMEWIHQHCGQKPSDHIKAKGGGWRLGKLSDRSFCFCICNMEGNWSYGKRSYVTASEDKIKSYMHISNPHGACICNNSPLETCLRLWGGSSGKKCFSYFGNSVWAWSQVLGSNSSSTLRTCVTSSLNLAVW